MYKLFLLLIIVGLCGCDSPAERKRLNEEMVDREQGGPVRYRALSQEWCHQLYHMECNYVCRPGTYSITADCDVTLNGQIRHLRCDYYSSCTEK